MKWFENENCDNSVVISSRVRLARNIKKYPFKSKIKDEDSKKILEEVKEAIMKESSLFATTFSFLEMEKLSVGERRKLVESHAISPYLLDYDSISGVLLKEDESVCIMINEEDHIRIQTIFSGEDIDKAWEVANEIDDLIEETLEYAFDENLGYITACPTNMGTGLRASFMVHIPAIEKAGQIKNLVTALSKFGITVRGIYGEGTEAMGSIYQISNQLTLGQNEKDIIKNLKTAVNFVKEQETKIRNNIFNDIKFIDSCYRAYGIITNARKISAKEAFQYLSEIREGFLLKILDVKKPKDTIYDIMINIQPAHMNLEDRVDVRDELRANYLREMFK